MKTGYHCEVVSLEHWYRLGCDQPAVVVYFDEQPVGHGYCARHHTPDVRAQAVLRGWKQLREEEMAA